MGPLGEGERSWASAISASAKLAGARRGGRCPPRRGRWPSPRSGWAPMRRRPGRAGRRRQSPPAFASMERRVGCRMGLRAWHSVSVSVRSSVVISDAGLGPYAGNEMRPVAGRNRRARKLPGRGSRMRALPTRRENVLHGCLHRCFACTRSPTGLPVTTSADLRQARGIRAGHREHQLLRRYRPRVVRPDAHRTDPAVRTCPSTSG